MITKIMNTRVPVKITVIGILLATFAHIYLNNQFPRIF